MKGKGWISEYFSVIRQHDKTLRTEPSKTDSEPQIPPRTQPGQGLPAACHQELLRPHNPLPTRGQTLAKPLLAQIYWLWASLDF